MMTLLYLISIKDVEVKFENTSGHKVYVASLWSKYVKSTPTQRLTQCEQITDTDRWTIAIASPLSYVIV